MRFSVDTAPDELHFLERKPIAVCRNGHEECSFRHGGPCWQYECTCTTTGNCMSCANLEPR